MQTQRLLAHNFYTSTRGVLACPQPPLALSTHRSFSSRPSTAQQELHLSHTCNVNAEPWYHYKKNGYHPTHLGDVLKNGRYEVVHKLGWGGYSTVLAARDHRFVTPLLTTPKALTLTPGTTSMLP